MPTEWYISEIWPVPLHLNLQWECKVIYSKLCYCAPHISHSSCIASDSLCTKVFSVFFHKNQSNKLSRSLCWNSLTYFRFAFIRSKRNTCSTMFHFYFIKQHRGAIKMKGSDGLQATKLKCIQLLDAVKIHLTFAVLKLDLC